MGRKKFGKNLAGLNKPLPLSFQFPRMDNTDFKTRLGNYLHYCLYQEKIEVIVIRVLIVTLLQCVIF